MVKKKAASKFVSPEEFLWTTTSRGLHGCGVCAFKRDNPEMYTVIERCWVDLGWRGIMLMRYLEHNGLKPFTRAQAERHFRDKHHLNK